MQNDRKNRSRLGFALGLLGLALSAGFAVPSARAQDLTATPEGGAQAPPTSTHHPAARRKAAQKSAARYFIEFRSRYALSYGHTFAAFGRLNARGDIVESEVAGLHPAGDSPVPWMIGHLLVVPSETGPSDGDLEDQYISARYRVELNEAEYSKVTAYIRQLKANSPLWHAVMYNCNAFVADIARSMGLRTPNSTLQYPPDFINELREMNKGQQHAAAEMAVPSVQ